MLIHKLKKKQSVGSCFFLVLSLGVGVGKLPVVWDHLSIALLVLYLIGDFGLFDGS